MPFSVLCTVLLMFANFNVIACLSTNTTVRIWVLFGITLLSRKLWSSRLFNCVITGFGATVLKAESRGPATIDAAVVQFDEWLTLWKYGVNAAIITPAA